VRDGITGTAWGAAWNAAWAAAWAAIPGSPAARLAPTLAALQASAFGLLADLLPGEVLELPGDEPAVAIVPVTASRETQDLMARLG
jgi:hypothetical protein